MRRKPCISTAIFLLAASILACNFPSAAQPTSVNDQAATIIAATLTAGARNSTDIPVTAASSPVPQPTSAIGPTPTITPTYSTPMLTVLQSTNCRSGPGQDYEIVFTYLPNKKLEILGRYEVENYWLVKSAESPTGQCWLWGEYVEVTGSYWVVSSVTPPPTATLPPPLAPSIQKWDFFCSLGNMSITITWTDRATNEAGYRILRNGEVVAELPADSTTYTEKIELLAGESAIYVIQVYNVTDTVNSSQIRLTC
jgi:hypothetical protein